MPDKAKVVKSTLQALSDALRELRAKAYSEPDKALVEVECVKALIQIRPAFVALATEGSSATDADETGEFKLKGLLDQPYTVLAIGRVGMNAGLWLDDLPPSARHDRLRLVKPTIACYDPSHFF